MNDGNNTPPAAQEFPLGPDTAASHSSPGIDAPVASDPIAEKKAKSDQAAALRADKLQGIPNIGNPELLFESAAIAADRLTVGPRVSEFLYTHSRFKGDSRSEWERQLKTSMAIDLIMRTHFRYEPLSIFETLLDRNAINDAFQRLQSPKGTLALTFHGGFSLIVRKIFTETPDKGISFGRGGTILADDLRTGMFTALRALQSGQQLALAPDGPEGKRFATLDVLGKPAPCGEGAAYLAYTSGCDTVWYGVARDGNRFTPQFEKGPSKDPGETFASFRDRLHGFYAKKIEEVFTGPPGSIGLRPAWARLFSNKPAQ